MPASSRRKSRRSRGTGSGAASWARRRATPPRDATSFPRTSRCSTSTPPPPKSFSLEPRHAPRNHRPRRRPAARRDLHASARRRRRGGLMRWATHLGGARATIGTGLLLVAVGERRLGLAVLVALALSHVAVQVLKRAVARPRACDANGHPLALVDLPDPFSFPSGHAAAASAIATTLVLRQPIAAVLIVPIALLVS